MYQQTFNQLLINSGLILGKVVVKCQLSVSDISVEYFFFFFYIKIANNAKSIYIDWLLTDLSIDYQTTIDQPSTGM